MHGPRLQGLCVLVVLNSTVEMTGMDFQAALRASGKVQVSVERCHFM
jgi:hypothetical protein